MTTCDLDPNKQHRVSLQEYSYDSLLTEVFHESNHHSGQTLISNFTNNDDHQRQEIIVIRRDLDKAKIAMGLISLLSISVALSLVVAVITHSAIAGLTVGNAGLTLTMFLQMLASWFAR